MSNNKSWDNAYKEKWDNRYKEPAFAYGKTPNLFFKEWLDKFAPGHILLPAEGEGRNGVYAAVRGWQVTAFDLSAEGRVKALALAAENEVSLQYEVGALEDLQFEPSSFDAIGLIYAHFAANKKAAYHKELLRLLKPGGVVILEAFSKDHLRNLAQDPKVGGPTDLDMLYSTAEIEQDFAGCEVLYLKGEEIVLQEGVYHNGRGRVVRFVGRMKV